MYSDFASFFRTYFAHVILLSSDFCFSLLYLCPAVLPEHKKAFPAAQRERFWFVFCFIFFFMAIPHNSKCRYGERGVADAKPKAQIILDAAKVSAASGGNSEPKQGQRSQSARGFCPRSTMRVPQPDIIEHFGNAAAVPQLPERCLSRKAGIVRYCLIYKGHIGVRRSGALPLCPGPIVWRHKITDAPPAKRRSICSDHIFVARIGVLH